MELRNLTRSDERKCVQAGARLPHRNGGAGGLAAIALVVVSLSHVLSPVLVLVGFLAEGAALRSLTAIFSGLASGYQAAIVSLPDHVQTQ